MNDVSTRILLVDDHPITRQGLRAVIETEPGLAVVGEAGDGDAAIRAARELTPDVILMDLVMPGMDGVEATRRILRDSRDTNVLVLTSYGTDDKLYPALEAGALGFLLKDSRADDLLAAIRQVARGESPLSPATASRLVRGLAGEPGRKDAHDGLSEREIDVLREIAHGLSNEEIADRLCISVPSSLGPAEASRGSDQSLLGSPGPGCVLCRPCKNRGCIRLYGTCQGQRRYDG